MTSIESQPQNDCTVAVYDPLPLVRHGLCSALRADGFDVREQPNSLGWTTGPGIAVVIYSLVGDQGLHELDEILGTTPETLAIVLLNDYTVPLFAAVLQRERSYPVLRSSSPSAVVDAVGCALFGEVKLPADVATSLARSAGAGDQAQSPLDPDETRWMAQLAGGKTVLTVAEHAGFSEREMFRRLSRVYRKLGVDCRAAAIAQLANAGQLPILSGASR